MKTNKQKNGGKWEKSKAGRLETSSWEGSESAVVISRGYLQFQLLSSFNVQCKCTPPVICRHVSLLRRCHFVAFTKQSVKY